MDMGKIETNVTYSNLEKGIYGLTITRFYRINWDYDYRVVEDTTPDLDWRDRKTVYRGSLTNCRQYVYERLNS